MRLHRPLAGRVVVVTGASSGIGRDLSASLAQRGAHVVAAARDEDRLAQLASEHPAVTPVPTDVTVDADRAALVAATVERHGRVDALINNAGLGWSAYLDVMGPEKVRELIETNLFSLIDLTQRVLPWMLTARDGDIVNIGSVAGFVTVPPLTVYGATKHAVVGFTDGLRRELVGTGVRAHLITPGPVRTEWAKRSIGYEPEPGAPERRGGGVPAALVVRAIERCLTRPWTRRASVPRILGAGRIGDAPLVRSFTDRLVASVAHRRFAPPDR